MTKKDYVLIAQALKDASHTNAGIDAPDAIQAAVYQMAATLAADNSRFDRARFLEACGVES